MQLQPLGARGAGQVQHRAREQRRVAAGYRCLVQVQTHLQSIVGHMGYGGHTGTWWMHPIDTTLTSTCLLNSGMAFTHKDMTMVQPSHIGLLAVCLL